jgi:hypothetical protein
LTRPANSDATTNARLRASIGQRSMLTWSRSWSLWLLAIGNRGRLRIGTGGCFGMEYPEQALHNGSHSRRGSASFIGRPDSANAANSYTTHSE